VFGDGGDGAVGEGLVVRVVLTDPVDRYEGEGDC